MIVERARESESVSKNLRHQIPVPCLPGGIPCLDNFSVWRIFKPGCLACNSLGKSCLAVKYNPNQKNWAKKISHFHKQFYNKTTRGPVFRTKRRFFSIRG